MNVAYQLEVSPSEMTLASKLSEGFTITQLNNINVRHWVGFAMFWI